MGFASGAVTFRRFFLVGKHPRQLTGQWLEALQAHAFGRHQTLSRDGVEFGWIKPTHLFDSDFTRPEALSVGRFIHLGLRIDRTAPPPAILRSYRMMEEAARLAESGKAILSRSERKEAREAAAARAEEEARSGAFRRVSATPVVFDLEDGVAYFGSLGNAAADRLVALCAQTFDVSLVPAHAGEVAWRFAQRAGLSRAYEELMPEHLTAAPALGSELHVAAVNETDRTFLGREFLMRLWRLVDDAEGLCPTAEGPELEFAIHRTMHLECEWGVSGRTSIRADAPARSAEARTALASGKQPARLGLMLALRGEEFSFTLSGPAWSVSSLGLPRSAQRDPAAILEERFMAMRDAAAALDSMFAAFLKLRLEARWPAEWSAIRRWAVDRGGMPQAAAQHRVPA